MKAFDSSSEGASPNQNEKNLTGKSITTKRTFVKKEGTLQSVRIYKSYGLPFLNIENSSQLIYHCHS